MGLMMLAASIGTEIEVEATGPDAVKAIEALNELVDAKFDEE
jgi:phosphocarrier protein